MHLTVKWFNNQFNINIASAEGKEEFLSIKGCRIANGNNGEFLSMPSTKNEQTGKYWNHAWASDAFANHVLKIAKESQPQQAPQRSAQGATRSNDLESDIPFAKRKDY